MAQGPMLSAPCLSVFSRPVAAGRKTAPLSFLSGPDSFSLVEFEILVPKSGFSVLFSPMSLGLRLGFGWEGFLDLLGSEFRTNQGAFPPGLRDLAYGRTRSRFLTWENDTRQPPLSLRQSIPRLDDLNGLVFLLSNPRLGI